MVVLTLCFLLFQRFGEDKAIYVYFFIALVLYNFCLCVYAVRLYHRRTHLSNILTTHTHTHTDDPEEHCRGVCIHGAQHSCYGLCLSPSVPVQRVWKWLWPHHICRLSSYGQCECSELSIIIVIRGWYNYVGTLWLCRHLIMLSSVVTPPISLGVHSAPLHCSIWPALPHHLRRIWLEDISSAQLQSCHEM